MLRKIINGVTSKFVAKLQIQTNKLNMNHVNSMRNDY